MSNLYLFFYLSTDLSNAVFFGLFSTNYLDEDGKPSIFLLPVSSDPSDPLSEKFINRDSSKFLQVSEFILLLQLYWKLCRNCLKKCIFHDG